MVKNLPATQEPQETWVQSLGQEDPLEEGMATHSSIRVWRIPWMEKPDRLQSMGSQRVRHDWMTNTWASLVAQRLKCLPTMQETRVPSLGQEDSLEKEMVTHSSILAGESHGWRTLVGYSPRRGKESDMTERLHFSLFLLFKLQRPTKKLTQGYKANETQSQSTLLPLWF